MLTEIKRGNYLFKLKAVRFFFPLKGLPNYKLQVLEMKERQFVGLFKLFCFKDFTEVFLIILGRKIIIYEYK